MTQRDLICMYWSEVETVTVVAYAPHTHTYAHTATKQASTYFPGTERELYAARHANDVKGRLTVFELYSNKVPDCGPILDVIYHLSGRRDHLLPVPGILTFPFEQPFASQYNVCRCRAAVSATCWLLCMWRWYLAPEVCGRPFLRFGAQVDPSRWAPIVRRYTVNGI